MEQLIIEIKAEITEMLTNMDKQVEGNKSAGLRARKSTNSLTKKLKEFRALSIKY